MLQSYKTVVSPLQGQHICNFSPTCSQFYAQSIQKYDFIVGTLMGSDRLQRCNPWAWSYLDKYYTGIDQERIYDPPEQHYQEKSKIKYQISISNNPVTEPTADAKHSVGDNQPQKTDLDFADYLFNNRDYTRAIGEYKRLSFTTPASMTAQKEYYNLILGECYLLNKEYKQALSYFNLDKAPLYQYGRARTLLASGQFDKARQALNSFDNENLNKEKIILTSVSYFKENDYKSGAAHLNQYQYLNDKLISELSRFDGKNLPKRNRTLSSIMSAVMPGLGQAYSDRFGDGLYSFITVASCVLISNYYWQNDAKRIKFSIFTLLTAFFYAGNIYGANIAARDYNRCQLNNCQRQIDEILREINFTPDYQYFLKKL
jgi:putative component of membrane protein insertase Oxa1/YidC/SpoIIIJ protein YidD